MTKSELMKLANELMERGLAYDRSDAMKLARAGRNEFYQFGFVNGKFVMEERF